MISVSQGNLNINISLIGRILGYLIITLVVASLLAGGLWLLGAGYNGVAPTCTVEKGVTTQAPADGVEFTTEYTVHVTPSFIPELYEHHKADQSVRVVKFEGEDKKFYIAKEDGTFRALGRSSILARAINCYERSISRIQELQRVNQLLGD
ncbi:hypothetical protein LCGC14_2854560 [marine sediment metagenome]|uniref:Uncharacterized protein n=1 Tax=marine sediment metagenome TaxID=412755 RepID=A0A0F8YU86_9ZZZZ